MRISQLFEKKKAVYSFEIFPPKASDDISKIYSTLESIKDIAPDYVSVTYSAGGSRNSRTAEIADLLKNRYGMEPLAHLTCVNSTMGEVEEAIDKLNKIGVENILALRGDRIEGQERGEFNYCTDLIPVIKRLSNADIGAACYPEGHPESRNMVEDIRNLKKKVDLGVTHLNTQLFFDNDVFLNFMDKVRLAGIDVPVQAGIMPLVKKVAVWRNSAHDRRGNSHQDSAYVRPFRRRSAVAGRRGRGLRHRPDNRPFVRGRAGHTPLHNEQREGGAQDNGKHKTHSGQDKR